VGPLGYTGIEHCSRIIVMNLPSKEELRGIERRTCQFIDIIVEGNNRGVTDDFRPGRVWVRVRVGWGKRGVGHLDVGHWSLGVGWLGHHLHKSRYIRVSSLSRR
jgi:hypothetical protein